MPNGDSRHRSSPNPNDEPNDDQPPPAKRQRLSCDVQNSNEDPLKGNSRNVESSVDAVSGHSDLGKRLQTMLMCVVCQEVPFPDDIYQCCNGHIMCDDCKTHLLADGRISGKFAVCPNCRVNICNNGLEQNLVVRQALWQLPIRCPECNLQLSEVKELSKHLKNDCEQRVVRCKYHCLGCDWEGTHQANVPPHDACCEFPHKMGKEIVGLLLRADAKVRVAEMPLLHLHRQLSASRINFVTLKMNWTYSGQWEGSANLHERIIESDTIYAFEEMWMLRLHLTKKRKELALSCQLVLLSTPRESLMVDHMIQMPQSLCGVKQQQDIRTRHYRQLFDSTNRGGGRQELPLVELQALYRLFAMEDIHLRLWMFLHC